MSDLLPPNATKAERAISLAVNRAPGVPIRTLWSPQTCPEGILPWLAWALSVDEWNTAWPLEKKRAAVAESIAMHRRKGTIGALRRALESLGYEVEVDEKTGTAYTFRLLFKVGEGAAGGALIDAAISQATDIALRQKNARSELIGSQYLSTNGATGGPIIAAAQLSGSETDVTEFAGPNGPAESYVLSEGLLVAGMAVPAQDMPHSAVVEIEGEPYPEFRFGEYGIGWSYYLTANVINLPGNAGTAWILFVSFNGVWDGEWYSDAVVSGRLPSPHLVSNWTQLLEASGTPVLTPTF